jgi:methionyl-tRNA formyltransferase
MSSPPRIIFAGTPDFAVASLEALLEADVNIVGVFTQPDRRAGRGKKMASSAVKYKALEHQLPVFQPASFKAQSDRELVKDLAADLMVVTAYGLILPTKVLTFPKLGCINVHASLLPRWRGAAPIQRAIEAGDTQSGICIMQIEKGLDTGPVLATAPLEIMPNETGGELHDRLMHQSKITLSEQLDNILHQRLNSVPQSEQGVTYAHKLNKQETRLDWTQTAVDLYNKIRAFNPWPVAISHCNGLELRILDAQITDQQTDLPVGSITHIDKAGLHVQTGAGGLALNKLQKPGGKPMDAKALLNGFNLNPSDRFE